MAQTANSLNLESAVATLGAMVKDNVTELGLVFSEDAPVTCEGSKRAVSHKFVPQLFEFASKLPESDASLITKLVCNGDNYTAWARRKRMLLAGETSNAYELYLLNLITLKQPKAPSAWEHRRFVAQRVLKGCKTSEGLAAFVKSEVDICERAVTLHRRNYYPWAHRAWLAPHMSVALVEEDIKRTKQWIEKNVSDASAFHHLELLNALLHDRKSELILSIGKSLEVAVNELIWCASLCNAYIGHDAIWNYRRACVARLLDFVERLNRYGWRGIKNALRSIDFTCPLTESQRMKSYDWWRLRCKDELPNVDAMLQLVFDELNVAAGLHLGDRKHEQYSSNSRDTLNDMKCAGAYTVWLSERIMDFFEKNVPETIITTPLKHLAPGCLRQTSIDKFIELFEGLDELDQEEFVSCFRRLPELSTLPDELILELFNAFDVDASNSVSRREFLSGAVVLCGGDNSKNKIAQSFAILDTNGNGTLDREELKEYCIAVFRVMALTNDLLKDGSVIEAIASASVEDAFRFSSDGQSLSLEEFSEWLDRTAKSDDSRPSAITTRLNLLEVANMILQAQ